MRKSRFAEAQIIGMLKEQEVGLPTAELCRKHGLSPATFYKLKAKYGGMERYSTAWPTPTEHWPSGVTTTTTSGRIHRSATRPRQKRRALEPLDGTAPGAPATPEADDYQNQGLSL